MTNSPRLVDAAGRPLQSDDGFLLPAARSFAAVWGSVSKTYSYRFDEAVRHSPQQALAMRRDPFIRALMQERKAPTRNLDWSVDTDDPTDAGQADAAARLTGLVKRTPRFRRMLSYLLEAIFYGRYGAQVTWGEQPDREGTVCTDHAPVNGDKVQYAWDGTPVILTGGLLAADLDRRGWDVVQLDRSGRGVKLSRPAHRSRFVIHTHEAEDADFFEGEMAGGVHGVGLRHLTFWYYYLRSQMLEAVVGILQTTGTADILCFNYDEGSKAGRQAAEACAAAVTGRVSIAVPRKTGSNYPAMEAISVATGGAELLKTVIFDVVDRYLERLYVGQSMSAGADDANGLGGTGRAELAESTKDQLIVSDADYLGETLTTDFLSPLVRYNFGKLPFDVRFRFSVGDPKKERKLERGLKLVAAGVELAEDELRDCGGFRKPGKGEKTVGKPPEPEEATPSGKGKGKPKDD